MSSPTLYQWPTTARFGRVVPKSKFYEHANISAKVRDAFVADVQSVTWAYKLADETVHLAPSEQAPEIQVFEVDAKREDVANAVLRAIDLAVPFPIIFEIRAERDGHSMVRTTAAHKELRPLRPPRKLTEHFSSAWFDRDVERAPLPGALDLAGLHAALLRPLLPVASSVGESVEDAAARITATRSVERDLERLNRKLRREKQLNRKLEIRRDIRALEARLAELTTPAPTK